MIKALWPHKEKQNGYFRQYINDLLLEKHEQYTSIPRKILAKQCTKNRKAHYHYNFDAPCRISTFSSSILNTHNDALLYLLTYMSLS